MADKKISELTVTSSIDAMDSSVLVRNDADLQFTFATLLQFVSNNISTGANFSFGTALPSNSTGKNGDVFINTSTGSFAQKISGAWVVSFTLASSTGSDGAPILYGLGIPSTSTGNNGDTYIDSGTGVFYQKTSGTWSQAFSMQTGPAGATGAKGTDGTDGVNGNTVVHGNGDPSNTIGVDGDFYLNTATYYFFGPKASGAWPAGFSIVGLGFPAGGADGQFLVKNSSADYDTSWGNVDLTGFVPYEGAGKNVDLGEYGLTAQNLTVNQYFLMNDLSQDQVGAIYLESSNYYFLAPGGGWGGINAGSAIIGAGYYDSIVVGPHYSSSSEVMAMTIAGNGNLYYMPSDLVNKGTTTAYDVGAGDGQYIGFAPYNGALNNSFFFTTPGDYVFMPGNTERLRFGADGVFKLLGSQKFTSANASASTTLSQPEGSNLTVTTNDGNSQTFPDETGTIALIEQVVDLTSNQAISGEKTFDNLLSVADAPFVSYVNLDPAAFDLSPFADSNAYGKLIVGMNYSAGESEVDFITTVGTSGAAIGGFRFYNLGVDSAMDLLFDVNGSTKDMSVGGQIRSIGIQPATTGSGDFIRQDTTISGLFVTRSASDIFSDITGELEETDDVAATMLLNITKDGVAYKLLAIAA